jgi:hypothetical protein
VTKLLRPSVRVKLGSSLAMAGFRLSRSNFQVPDGRMLFRRGASPVPSLVEPRIGAFDHAWGKQWAPLIHAASLLLTSAKRKS